MTTESASKYTIAVDDHRSFITVRLFGFWSKEDVKAFARDQQRAVRALSCKEGEHLVLADLSEFKLQSQEVVEACAQFIASAGVKARRLALVLGPGLAWMQAKRMVVREQVAAFFDHRIATKWLLTGDHRLEEQVDSLLAAKARAANQSI